MADRRMISKKVIETDKFIDLSLEQKLLYYELLLRADDDGFVASPKTISKICGVKESTLETLETENYIKKFTSGVCVILHWNVHNQVRKDRYHGTKYQEEIATLVINENGIYIEKKQANNENIKQKYNQLATNWQPRLEEVRLEEVRIGKSRLEEGSSSPSQISEKNVLLKEVKRKNCKSNTDNIKCSADIVTNNIKNHTKQLITNNTKEPIYNDVNAEDTNEINSVKTNNSAQDINNMETAEKNARESSLLGEYKNVLLTSSQLKKLKSKFTDYSQKIDRLSEYLEISGKQYNNHYAAIVSWAKKDNEQKNAWQNTQNTVQNTTQNTQNTWQNTKRNQGKTEKQNFGVDRRFGNKSFSVEDLENVFAGKLSEFDRGGDI